MAFSAKDHNLGEKGRTSNLGGSTLDSSHNPGNNMFTYASFFKDINSQKRTPFNVAPSIAHNGVTGKALDFTSTFVEAQDDFSFVIDCAQFVGMHFKEKSLSSSLREQYPKGLGIRHRVVGKNHKVIEINFPTEEDCMEALQKEFVLQGGTIQVNKTLDKQANVIRVSISAIPYKPVEVLKPLLIETFEKYGDILNVGLCHSKDGDWFTGRGFVTLNLDKSKNYAAELRPQIAFGNFQENIRLVWSNMQPICTDCHTDDHVKADCPRKRRKACHKCGSLEHLIATCPQAYWNRKKDQPFQERRLKSVNEEHAPSQQTTGREVDLFDLMKVSRPKHFAKKQGNEGGKSKMDTDEDSKSETSSMEEDSDPPQVTTANESSLTGTKEVDEPLVEETANPPSTAPHNQEDSTGEAAEATNNALKTTQHVNQTIEESEYETDEGGDNSDTAGSPIVPSFRDKYNLRNTKMKAISTEGDIETTGDTHKRSLKDLASSPTGSEQEGPTKKILKQQDDTTMDDADHGSASTTKSL
ncbi:hypothetical protein PS15p_202775 [Mucor circinelloides]